MFDKINKLLDKMFMSKNNPNKATLFFLIYLRRKYALDKKQ